MPTRYGTQQIAEVVFYDKKTGETIAIIDEPLVSLEFVKSEVEQNEVPSSDSSDDKVDIAEVIVKFLNEIYVTDSWTWEKFVDAVTGEGVLIMHFYELATEYFKQMEAVNDNR